MLSAWTLFIFVFSGFEKIEQINYADVFSEVTTVLILGVMLAINLRWTRKNVESFCFFYGFLITICSHTHDLFDEFLTIEPASLAFVLENITGIIGLLLMLVGVRYWSIKNRRQIKQLKEQQVTLTSQSYQDGLTGLYNRRYLQNELLARLSQTLDNAPTCTLVMIDLDNFKNFNDSYGHLAGDKLIQHAAHVISGECRGQDTVVRYGGEEFLVLLAADIEVAQRVAERIRLSYRASIFKVEETLIQKSLSVGLAKLSRPERFEQDLKLADDALYQAKKDGKNQVVIAK